VGFCYGLLAHPVDEMAGLRDLALIFLWAEVYDDFYAPIGSAVRSFSAMGPASMLVRHALNAFHGHSPFRHKTQQAREQREQIVAELKDVMKDPGTFFAELPGKMKAEYTDKWRRHKALRAQSTLNSQFQAGKLAGEVTMELLLTIAGLIAMGGAAAAKLATKTPQLVKWARRVTVRAGRVGAGDEAGFASTASETVAPLKKSAPAAPPKKATPRSEPVVEGPPTRLPLAGVTGAEMDLAAAPTSPYEAVATSQLKARRKVASQFYREHGGGMSESQIADHVRGIDFTEPVKAGPPPPAPAVQHQWQVTGARQGSYYADSGTAPTNLGINAEGRGMGPNGWATGEIEPKVAQPFEVPSDTPYLQSTSAPYLDTHSVPDMPMMTEGGATQRYIPGLRPK
jgi:hypothetical protein